MSMSILFKIKKIARKGYSIIKPRIPFLDDDKKAELFLKKHPMKELSTEEKQEIDDYWGQFGIKFPHYKWFEMYYGVTGIHDPRFIPDMIAGHILFPHYNEKQFIAAWADKNLFERYIPTIQFPTTLCHKFNGSLYDDKWNYFSKEDIPSLANNIIKRLNSDNSFVLKLTRNSAAGKGVKIYNIKTSDDICEILNNNPSPNYIIQKKIRQHSFFQQFNKSSVNILRVVSWKHEGKVDILSVSIRYGIEGSYTDVAYVNGEEIVNVVGVNKSNGQVNHHYANLDGIIPNVQFHLQDEFVPCFNEVIDLTKKAHLQLQPFNIIGWDFTINEDCIPICIEYNVVWPGTILYQYANGPFAGDLTDDLLSFLKEDNNQNLNIPKQFKL